MINNLTHVHIAFNFKLIQASWALIMNANNNYMISTYLREYVQKREYAAALAAGLHAGGPHIHSVTRPTVNHRGLHMVY